MLLAAFRFKSEHGWRRFEIPSGKVISYNTNLASTAIHSLKQMAGIIKQMAGIKLINLLVFFTFIKSKICHNLYTFYV